jgi:hypothetical protein
MSASRKTGASRSSCDKQCAKIVRLELGRDAPAGGAAPAFGAAAIHHRDEQAEDPALPATEGRSTPQHVNAASVAGHSQNVWQGFMVEHGPEQIRLEVDAFCVFICGIIQFSCRIFAGGTRISPG